MTLPGIDISAYQKPTPDLTGLSFCLAKASEGLATDPMYATHLAAMKGITTGAYHFARSDISTPTLQAQHFLDVAGDVGLYALDVEGLHAFTLAQSSEFIAAMHAAGKRIGMYHSLSGFPHAGQDWDWVAYYNPTSPPIHWDMWQYGPRVIGGASIDGDTFAGDQAALDALTGRHDMFVSLKEKAEDWTPTGTTTSNGVLRATPDAGAAVVSRVPLGTIVRSTAEVTTSSAVDNDWRVTMVAGVTLYMLRRDWNPLVQGGDPTVQASFQAFVDRAPDPGIDTARKNGYNAGVAAVQQQANSVKPI